MKSFLIKLIISLVIVIFVPLPNPLFTKQTTLCDEPLFFQGLPPSGFNSIEDACPSTGYSIQFEQNGLNFIATFTSAILSNGNQVHSTDVQPAWTYYAPCAIGYLVLIFVLLSIIEFTYKKLKRK